MLERILSNTETIRAAMAPFNLQEEIEDTIVAIYEVSGKTFDKDAYLNLVHFLTESFDYALMNMNTAAIFAALLLIRYDFPLSKVSRLKLVIERVRNSGFRSRVSNYLAFVLLEEEEVDDRLSKSLSLYHEMQEKHGLITGEDDYLTSVYLSSLMVEEKAVIDMVETIYTSLASLGMKKGNALQNLSHQLTILSSGDYEPLIQDVKKVYDKFHEHKIKLNNSQYVLLGLIGFFVKDLDRFMGVYLADIESYKQLLDCRRLRTLQLNVITVMTLKKYLQDTDTSLDMYTVWQQKNAHASLMMLLVNYLFRERLL